MIDIESLELEPLSEVSLDRECVPFDFADPPCDPIELAHRMVKIMVDANGLGLAANQIGFQYRVVAFRGMPENFVLFNPKIVSASDETMLLKEGCLSYPGLYVKIARPVECRVRYTQPNGETLTQIFKGLSSKVIHHEMDHLDGVVFYSRASKFNRDAALRKWRFYNRRAKKK